DREEQLLRAARRSCAFACTWKALRTRSRAQRRARSRARAPPQRIARSGRSSIWTARGRAQPSAHGASTDRLEVELPHLARTLARRTSRARAILLQRQA